MPEQDSAAKDVLPTREQCWINFWNILGPELVELHQRGILPATCPVRAQLPTHVSPASSREYSQKDVRLWLRSQGRPVSRSGRLSYDLLDEYECAVANQIIVEDESPEIVPTLGVERLGRFG